jgi:hypothetical protein
LCILLEEARLKTLGLVDEPSLEVESRIQVAAPTRLWLGRLVGSTRLAVAVLPLSSTVHSVELPTCRPKAMSGLGLQNESLDLLESESGADSRGCGIECGESVRSSVCAETGDFDRPQVVGHSSDRTTDDCDSDDLRFGDGADTESVSDDRLMVSVVCRDESVRVDEFDRSNFDARTLPVHSDTFRTRGRSQTVQPRPTKILEPSGQPRRNSHRSKRQAQFSCP